ncbi:MAG: Nucleotidyltransferase domain protein [Actinobacteria bacterium]|nr:Nucleotidyltransferase domain protein [Actinomycetota bacterium]
MKDRYLSPETRCSIADIARKRGLSLVVLFGSVAANDARPDSDIDIAVKFGGGDPGLFRILEVQEEISGLFGGRKVDLSVLNRADPLFMKKIAERCEFLFAEPGEESAFLLMAFRRYQDHRKYLDMERDFAAEYVKGIAS